MNYIIKYISKISILTLRFLIFSSFCLASSPFPFAASTSLGGGKGNNHLLDPGKTRGQTWRQRSCLPQSCFSHPQQLLLMLQRSIHKFPQYQVCKNKNNQAGSTWSYTKSASKSTRLLLRTNPPSSPHQATTRLVDPNIR